MYKVHYTKLKADVNKEVGPGGTAFEAQMEIWTHVRILSDQRCSGLLSRKLIGGRSKNVTWAP